MNRYYYDSVLRMSVEMSLFMVPGGFTINDMAELLNLDKRIIREDVYNLFTFDAMRGLLNVNIDSEALNYSYINDYFKNVSLDDYDVEKDFACDRKLKKSGEKRKKLPDDIKLNQYITCYLDLSDLQGDIKYYKEDDGNHASKNESIFEKFKIVYSAIPSEFDLQKSWKGDFIFQLKRANQEKDWEKLIKNIENAKIRILRRIKGTTENGVRKGRNKDGEKYGILSGLYDDIKFILEDSYLGYDRECGEYMLALSSEEYTHLNEFLIKQGTPLKKMDGLFKVKNSLEIIQRESIFKYDVLEKIKSGKCIKFEYTNKKTGLTDWVKIEPKWINYNSDTGFMYLVDSDDYKYKVDRIKGLKIYDLEKGEVIDKKTKIEKKLVTVIIHIPKIEGYDNLIYKIKEDVKRRNMDPSYKVDDHFFDDGDRFVYCDRIDESELGAMKSWIYSYGSSMVVVEPLKLRKEIIDSYRKRLEYYS